MKIFFSLFFNFIFLFAIYGQIEIRTRRVVQIATEQSFYLNSSLRASFGGKSKTTLVVKLPRNTIEWYYTFSTSPGQNTVGALNLLSQLTKLFDPTGTTSILASSILTPTGSNVCDIYFIDYNSINSFMVNGDFLKYDSGSRENFKNGTVNIKDITRGEHYLGIKNSSATAGINVKIEVAAIVEDITEDDKVWSSETKEKFSNNFFKLLKHKYTSESLLKEISNCSLNNLITEKTPETFFKMTENEKSNYIDQIMKQCSLKFQADSLETKNEKGIMYGKLGEDSYKEGNIDKCIENSKKALLYNNHLGWVKANLGLCLLLKEDDNASTNYFVEALSDIKNDIENKRKQIKNIIRELEKLLKKNPNLKSDNAIKSLFVTELKND